MITMASEMSERQKRQRAKHKAEVEAAAAEFGLPTIEQARVVAVQKLNEAGWVEVEAPAAEFRHPDGRRGRLSYIPAFKVHPELIQAVQLRQPNNEDGTIPPYIPVCQFVPKS